MVRGTPPLMAASHPALLGAVCLGEVWGGVKTREYFSFQATFGGHPACPEANRMDEQVHLDYRGLKAQQLGLVGP